MNNLKSILINFAKILVAVLIIYWLVKNGKLDFSKIKELLHLPHIVISASVLILLQIYIGSVRWYALLKTKSSQLKYTKQIFCIQWIGQFFSAALPGAVTGDFVKITYLKKIDHELTTNFLLYSVFVDRLLGLIGLLILSGLNSFIFYQTIIEYNPEMPNIVAVNFLLFAGALLVMLFFCFPPFFIDLVKKMIPWKKIHSLFDVFLMIKVNKRQLFKLITLSMLSHLVGFLVFYLINHSFFESSIRFQDLMSVIPIGQITIALPISPSGLGVGHLAYQKLFSFINQSNGAVLFNNFWFISLIVNILGCIPYIFTQDQKKF